MIDKLKAAGKLPKGYGEAANNHLPRNGKLLGRANELSAVLAALADERQVMLVGGPGEGKSALAAEAAHVLSEQRRLSGGAHIIDLATAPAGVPLLT